jgi:asparagine synthase (glutamine-hydrolysing)
VLREVAKDCLPDSIVKREKQGFMFPVAYWFQHELQGFLRGILLDSHFVNAGIFNPTTITQLLDEHHHGRTDHHVRLWMLLNLTIWHRLYIENLTVNEVTVWLGSYLEN